MLFKDNSARLCIIKNNNKTKINLNTFSLRGQFRTSWSVFPYKLDRQESCDFHEMTINLFTCKYVKFWCWTSFCFLLCEVMHTNSLHLTHNNAAHKSDIHVVEKFLSNEVISYMQLFIENSACKYVFKLLGPYKIKC